MRTVKTYLIIGALTLVFLLASCNPELVCDAGTDGVSASFTDRNSMRMLEQDREMPIVVSIKNNGASPAEGIVRLRFNQDLVRVEPLSRSFDELPGKEDWNRCLGQEDRVLFSVNPYPLPITAQKFDTDLSLDVCYKYATNFSTTVCVDPRSPGINVLDPNCVPAEKSFSGGQGGPLGIVRVSSPVYYDDTNGPGSARIRFTLENYGNGRIVTHINPDNLELSCSLNPDVFENYLYVKAFLDDQKMECTELNPDIARAPTFGVDPQGNPAGNKTYLRADPEQIETRDGVATLRRFTFVCTVPDLELDRELDMRINMELAYFYRDSRSDTMTVELRKI
jgi:hypothetical protein